MGKKPIAALVLVVAAGVGAYWYYSPYLVMQATQDAAQARDAEAFNARVDYPRVRESFKGQMGALVTGNLKPGEEGAVALGAMLGLALVNQMVDAFVRPEVVMRAMQEGQIEPDTGGDANPPRQGEARQDKTQWTFKRHGPNKVIAYGRQAVQPEDEALPGFVFERSGFADWKLTEIRLPQMR